MVHVGLDVTPLVGPLSGVGVFTRRLVDGLADLASDDVTATGLAFTARGRSELSTALPASMALGRLVPARVARAAWLRANWPTARTLGGDLDLVHGTNFVVPPGGGAVELVTVHDFGPWTTPDLVSRDALDFPPLVARAVSRGAHVHVVSSFVADEAKELLRLEDDRVHTVSLGIDRPSPATVLSRPVAERIGDQPFVLAVGAIELRKKFDDLVRAMDRLSQDHRELTLVIAGGPGTGSESLRAAIDKSTIGHRVELLGYVSADDKAALLRAASVVASSAVHEGFGMVPLEAMAAGTPVVAVAGGSIPEVCGDAALLVDPGDVEGLAAGLDRALTHTDTREHLMAAGRLQVDRFSWNEMVNGMVQLYGRLTR